MKRGDMVMTIGNECGCINSFTTFGVSIRTFSGHFVFATIDQCTIAPSLKMFIHFKLNDSIYRDNIYIVLN